MKTMEQILQDYLHIHQALNVLEKISIHEHVEEAFPENDVEVLLTILREFVHKQHQEKEEGVLFPALLRGHGQKNHRELAELVFEHTRERFLVERLEDSIRYRKTTFPECAARLIRLLRTNMDKERGVLSRLTAESLSPEADERVSAEMGNCQRCWQEDELPELLHALENVGAKYVAVTA